MVEKFDFRICVYPKLISQRYFERPAPQNVQQHFLALTTAAIRQILIPGLQRTLPTVAKQSLFLQIFQFQLEWCGVEEQADL